MNRVASMVLGGFLAALATSPAPFWALAGESQPTGIKVHHHKGQTFIVWTDAAAGPDARAGADAANKGGKKAGKKGGKGARKDIRYRVYRSESAITSVEGMKPIGSTGPRSSWNRELCGRGNQRKMTGKPTRYVVKEKEGPLPENAGLYVHNPKKAGQAFYAVTCSSGGTENKSIAAGNATQAPITEEVGQGEPVLQRVTQPEKFTYVRKPTIKWYTRWEAPPNCARENRPIDYILAFPPSHDESKPWIVGLHFHCWGGSLTKGYGPWSHNAKAVLLSSNQYPYDWWTGYHERYYLDGKVRANKKADLWKKGVVRPYSTRRTFSFFDWLATKHKIDTPRTFVVGNSMGGSGSVMCAIRYSERIAWCRSWVGVHNPAGSPRFKGSYAGVYGDPAWGVKFEDGTPVWDYYNDIWYLKKYPNKEIGFITFSNGKNDGGIGWVQAMQFARTMQATKRPHLFVWGQAGHGQRAALPGGENGKSFLLDLRTDLSQPAFTGCSLDNDPGTGRKTTEEEKKKEAAELATKGIKPKGKKGLPDPFDGDREGQFNRWLYWESKDIVDEAETWEMTVGLQKSAPKPECTVDITPRRLQKFKVKPGEAFKWTNSKGGAEVQNGEVKADENGLITLPKVKVTVGKNRIKIMR